jgi:hypothetical protein
LREAYKVPRVRIHCALDVAASFIEPALDVPLDVPVDVPLDVPVDV